MKIYKYETQEEANSIITQKKIEGYIVTHIQNVTEGNFLGFTKKEDSQPPVDVLEKLTQIEIRLKNIEEGQDSLKSESLSK